MAKIIDALIITLTLNTKGFSQGQKEVSEKLKKTRKDAAKTADEMEDSGKRAGEFFATLKKGALGLASAYLTLKGFKDIIIGSKNSVVELAKASQLLDIPARKLDALSRTVREFNVSDEGFLGGLKAIQQGVTAFKITGGQQGQDIVSVLGSKGVHAFDINREPRDAWSITQDFLKI